MSDSETYSASSMHSAGSVSLSKMECPYCNKDLQVRNIFAHIRKMHNKEFLENTSKRWINEAEKGKPLKVWWFKKNDFDELEDIVIYVCLSTNKTFTTEYRANLHFEKSKETKKEHDKQLKQVLKDMKAYEKAKKKEEQEYAKKNPTAIAFKNNDSALARALWKGIMHHKKVCMNALTLCSSESVNYYIFNKNKEGTYDFERFDKVSYTEFVEHHQALMNKIDKMYEEKCMDTNKLFSLWHKTYCFWRNNYVESLIGFREDMKALFPSYNHCSDNNPKNFGFCSDEMQEVNI